MTIQTSQFMNVAHKSQVRFYHCHEIFNRDTIYASMLLDFLTHWGLNKMARLFSYSTFKLLLLNEKFSFLIQISLKLFPKLPIESKLTLVQVLAWHLICDEPSLEPMLAPNWWQAITWTNFDSMPDVMWHPSQDCNIFTPNLYAYLFLFHVHPVHAGKNHLYFFHLNETFLINMQ